MAEGESNTAAIPANGGPSGSSRSITSRQSQRPPHHRMESLKRSVSTGVRRSQSAVAHFLGVEETSEEDSDERQKMWEARRVTLGRRLGAKAKPSLAPSVEEGMTEVTDAPARPSEEALLAQTINIWKKPSVAQMAWRKVAKAAVSETSPDHPRGPVRRQESFPPHVQEETAASLPMEDLTMKGEEFFKGPGVNMETYRKPAFTMAVQAFASKPARMPQLTRSIRPPQPTDSPSSTGSPDSPSLTRSTRSVGTKREVARAVTFPITVPVPVAVAVAPLAKPEEETDVDGLTEFVQTKMIKPRGKSRLPGMDFMSRIFGGHGFLKKPPPTVEEQMLELLDHRPYFTYWVTIVQILVLLVSIAVYGFAPVGFDHRQQSSLILETSLALETVDYLEPENFWLGPRANHLIHLGAKYAPCMRPDDKIGEQIAADRASENETACCVRNDGSGCVQSSRRKCSKTMATFYKWPNKNSEGRVSGSVCGLDPHYCTDPPSVGPHAWPDDITRWPICKKKANVSIARAAPHMSCEVVGHPCCTGTRGECQITTREYCDFVQGYFHEDALLCSQVSCMDKICGMLPFLDPEVPDQFYRLWTAIFLHAGVLHLLITVVFQYIVMRDAEKLTGFIRMGIIYTMSGIGGNLASAIFTPYVAEVGPSGSQFGVFACVFVEIIYSWKLLDRPWIPVLRMSLMVLFLFVVGLFPWTDNYAHIFGFLFGFLLSLALLPGVAFGGPNRRCKVWTIILSLLATTALFALLIVLFYIHPIYDCEGCGYLNCVPITENFCDNQKIVIAKRPTD